MPKVVEVVHVLGQPADMEPLVDACERHGIPVLEDAAESLGATWSTGRYAGRHTGTVGAVGCFSFNGNKIATTGGRRHDRHRRRRARRAGPPPDDPGEGARRRLPPRRGRLQLPAHQHRRRASGSPSSSGSATSSPPSTASPRATTRRSATCRSSCRRGSPGSTRPTGSTPCSCPSPTAGGATTCSTTSTAAASGRARCGVRSTPSRPSRRRRSSGERSADGLFERGVSLPCATELTAGDQERVIAAVRSFFA